MYKSRPTLEWNRAEKRERVVIRSVCICSVEKISMDCLEYGHCIVVSEITLHFHSCENEPLMFVVNCCFHSSWVLVIWISMKVSPCGSCWVIPVCLNVASELGNEVFTDNSGIHSHSEAELIFAWGIQIKIIIIKFSLVLLLSLLHCWTVSSPALTMIWRCVLHWGNISSS